MPVERGIQRLTWAVVFIGILIRVHAYLQRPCLWYDELLLSLGIVTHSFGALTLPRSDLQVAPLLFSWFEKAAVTFFGVSEPALRLLPLLAGVALLPLAVAIGRRFGDSRAALLAAALTAFCPALIRYSNDVKQYGVDAAVSAVLILVVSPIVLGEFTLRRGWTVSAVGLIAILISMPAVMVLAGVWLAVWVAADRKGAAGRYLWFVATGMIWGVSFGASYLRLYALSAGSDYMRQYWAPGFLSQQRSVWGVITAIAEGFLDPVWGRDGNAQPILILAGCLLFGGGVLYLWNRHGKPAVVLFTAPALAVLAAASIDKWVLTPRLMLFMAPLTIVVLSMGASLACNRIGPRSRTQAFLLLVLALLLSPVKYAAWLILHPQQDTIREEVRDAMAKTKPGDLIYLYAGAIPGWIFYSEDWSAPDWARVRALCGAMERIGPNPGNNASREHPVEHEGFDLNFPFRGRQVLFGISSGAQGNSTGYHGERPDPGWAGNEADRILAIPPWTVLVLVSQLRAPVVEELFTSLQARGGWLVESGGAVSRWHKFRFPISSR
jgi:hypothetical protein